jgi:ATP-dependent DNA helicase RecG
MTEVELQAWLRQRFPEENEAVEWKEWTELNHCIAGREADDLVSYVSAIANMEGGHIVLGVKDGTLAITGIADPKKHTAQSVPQLLLDQCTSLPSLGLRVEEIVTLDTQKCVWIVHVPKHPPRQPVYAHKKAWQRVGDSLVKLREDRHQAILAEPLNGADWSACVVEHAALADLDADALRKAREQFAAKHSMAAWFGDIASWSDAVFLDKARLTINGKITRAALLLLGRDQSTHLLSPYPAEISWRLAEERAVEHFHPPFLLTTSQVLQRIRIPNIKLFPANQLLAIELPKYDTKVILEALHNCIAHQDFERCERIVVDETIGHLTFRNGGGFFDGEPDQYITGERTPAKYRNKCLAAAMVELGMIDSAGFGVSTMFATQRKRFLPLPEYAESNSQQVTLRVYGQTIDENYSRMLMERTDLPLEQVVWLDRVQKKHAIDDAHAQVLRRAGLIEGRKPKWTVSAMVAAATNTQTQYLLNKGFDDAYYKRLMLERLEKFGPTSGRALRELVIDKLPAVLDHSAKEIKVKNLLTGLRKEGLNGKQIEVDPSGPGRGPNSIWRLKPAN